MISSFKWWLLQQEKRWLPGASIGARFARGTFWMISSAVIINALSLATSVITARLLGKVHFGEFGMINSTIAMFASFASFGIVAAATKHVAQWRHTDPARAGRFIGLLLSTAALTGTLAMTVLFLAGPLLAAYSLHAPYLTDPLRLSCLILLCGSLNGALSGGLAGLEAFRKLAQVTFVQSFLTIAVMLTLVWAYGLPGAVAALVIVSASTGILYCRALLSECRAAGIPITTAGCWRDAPILWHFSLPLFMGSMLASPALWIINTIVVRQPGGYADMGLINAANQWKIGILTLPAIFCSAAMPILSSESDRGDQSAAPDGFKETLDMTIKIAILAVLPLCTVILFLGDSIMSMYGRLFVGGYPVLLGISCAAGILALCSPLGTALSAQGKNWVGLGLNLLWAAVLITLSYVLIPHGGAVAYGMCAAGAALTQCCAISVYMRRSVYPITIRRIAIATGYILVITAACSQLSGSVRMIISAPMIITGIILAFLLLGNESRSKILLRIREIGASNP